MRTDTCILTDEAYAEFELRVATGNVNFSVGQDFHIRMEDFAAYVEGTRGNGNGSPAERMNSNRMNLLLLLLEAHDQEMADNIWPNTLSELPLPK